MYHVLPQLSLQSQSQHYDKYYSRLVRVNHVQILILPTQPHCDRSRTLQPDMFELHGWVRWSQANYRGGSRHKKVECPDSYFPHGRRYIRVRHVNRLARS